MIRYWFYVYENGMLVAKGDCPSREQADREAIHYSMMYAQDGGEVKYKVRKVTSKG